MEIRRDAHEEWNPGRSGPGKPGTPDRAGRGSTLAAGLTARLFGNWVYGGTLSGVLLLALLPLLTAGWPETLRLTFLFLPLYMLHQYEEHDADRFRLFFNASIGGGREVLTLAAVFVINVPGVWGVIALATYLSAWVAQGFGLIAVYLAVINALAHVGQAVLLRRYNPGLVTAMAVFLPVGVYTIDRFDAAGAGGWAWQAAGIGSAVAIHLAIVGYAKGRKRLAVRSNAP
jgi:hypothetical protein